MNFPFYMAKRIHFTDDRQRRVSRPAVRIASAGITVGLTVMIVTVAIVMGFKHEIRNKVVGFGSHIQITRYDNNSMYETRPIVFSDSLMQAVKAIPGIRHIQYFVSKPGVIKTESDFQGVIFKGIDRNFDWNFFSRNLTAGKPFATTDSVPSNNAVLSKKIADMLHLKVNDSFIAYFVQDRIQARKFVISGIYSTGFGDYDKLYILSDMRTLQHLNAWQPDAVSGAEITIDDFDRLEETGDQVYFCVANRVDRNGAAYYSQTIKDLNPQLFAWLDLFDINVWVILGLMMAVSGFVMISGLLILILERTNMIGMLKAMGSGNWTVRKIFLYHSCFLIGKGMIWGNVLAIAICLIQKYTHVIPLDPVNYYVSAVPVELNFFVLLLLNSCVFIVSSIILIAPSYLITKISPAQAIRYE